MKIKMKIKWSSQMGLQMVSIERNLMRFEQIAMDLAKSAFYGLSETAIKNSIPG